MDKEKIEKLMSNLDISFEEAKELIEADKEVDKMKIGEVNNDLTEEQKKVIKENSATKTKKVDPSGKTVTKEKKSNPTKQKVIETLSQAVAETGATEINIVNHEREFEFKIEGVKYKIVLSVPRK